jgi:aminopeptidase
MNFGPASPDLLPGAKNAVETCLSIKPGERVALIADEASRAVAASLSAAMENVHATCTSLLLEAFGPRPIKSAPAAVLEALETADVGILCMTPQPGELGARMAIVKIVERRQIRYAHMVDRGLDWVKTSGLISPRYWSNLPAGEVFTTPATVDGTFVCDASAGDHFNGKYGDLQGTPLVLEIKGARLRQVECERKDLQQEFWDYCHTDENSDRVGELAFGTNLGLSQMIGNLLQDEKFPGVHIAFGDPYGNQTHADWQSRTHVDVLTRNCDVWIDQNQIIAKGRYQLDHLGL